MAYDKWSWCLHEGAGVCLTVCMHPCVRMFCLQGTWLEEETWRGGVLCRDREIEYDIWR